VLIKLTKGKLFRLIAVATAICMLVTSSTSAKLFSRDVASWETKISAELWSIMAEKSNDDLIPIWLWLRDIDRSVITNALITERGLDPAIYENEVWFEKEIVADLARQVEERVGYEEAYCKDKDGMSLVDWAINDRVDEYIMAKREIVMREYSALNDMFITNNVGVRQREIIHSSRSSPSIILEATKTEIENYAKQSIVNDISLYVELIQETC